MQTADSRPVTKWRLDTKCRLQTANATRKLWIKTFFVKYVMTCHFITYQVLHNHFSAVILDENLYYWGIVLALCTYSLFLTKHQGHTSFLNRIPSRHIVFSLYYSIMKFPHWTCAPFGLNILLLSENRWRWWRFKLAFNFLLQNFDKFEPHQTIFLKNGFFFNFFFLYYIDINYLHTRWSNQKDNKTGHERNKNLDTKIDETTRLSLFITLSVKNTHKKHHIIHFDWEQNFCILDWPYFVKMLFILFIVLMFSLFFT